MFMSSFAVRPSRESGIDLDAARPLFIADMVTTPSDMSGTCREPLNSAYVIDSQSTQAYQSRPTH